MVIDVTGRLSGRGAYLCADGSCWGVALDKQDLTRALGMPLSDALANVREFRRAIRLLPENKPLLPTLLRLLAAVPLYRHSHP